jgi:hypothetical protein
VPEHRRAFSMAEFSFARPEHAENMDMPGEMGQTENDTVQDADTI